MSQTPIRCRNPNTIHTLLWGPTLVWMPYHRKSFSYTAFKKKLADIFFFCKRHTVRRHSVLSQLGSCTELWIFRQRCRRAGFLRRCFGVSSSLVPCTPAHYISLTKTPSFSYVMRGLDSTNLVVQYMPPGNSAAMNDLGKLNIPNGVTTTSDVTFNTSYNFRALCTCPCAYHAYLKHLSISSVKFDC